MKGIHGVPVTIIRKKGKPDNPSRRFGASPNIHGSNELHNLDTLEIKIRTKRVVRNVQNVTA